jgi:hypothetical protein
LVIFVWMEIVNNNNIEAIKYKIISWIGPFVAIASV